MNESILIDKYVRTYYKKIMSMYFNLLWRSTLILFSSNCVAVEHDMYYAQSLTYEGEYDEARTILLREEKTITDPGKLCTIYLTMNGIAYSTSNSSDGAKYAELSRKCYRPDSIQNSFFSALALYYETEYDKSECILDSIIKKAENMHSENNQPNLAAFADKNIQSWSYRIKALILLSRSQPKDVKAQVIYFAEKSYETTPFGQAEDFLASTYQVYNEDARLRSLLEKSDGKTDSEHAIGIIFDSIKKNK
jgi:hypothetical protein